MKYIILLLVILSTLVPLPVQADQGYVCRNYDGHKICILSIQRSAKKYWEYKASVSVDGVKTPIEVYNCRGKFKVQKDGTVVSFKQNDPGELICSFFSK